MQESRQPAGIGERAIRHLLHLIWQVLCPKILSYLKGKRLFGQEFLGMENGSCTQAPLATRERHNPTCCVLGLVLEEETIAGLFHSF